MSNADNDCLPLYLALPGTGGSRTLPLRDICKKKRLTNKGFYDIL